LLVKNKKLQIFFFWKIAFQERYNTIPTSRFRLMQCYVSILDDGTNTLNTVFVLGDLNTDHKVNRPDIGNEWLKLDDRINSFYNFICILSGFLAMKLIPIVPKSAALEDCGAPLNTSPRQVISKSTKPAAATAAFSSASSRAPAIQPVQRSMLALVSSEISF
jgi:hypothetical protein